MLALNTTSTQGRPRRAGILTGLAVSLLVHGLLIFAYQWDRQPATALPPADTMTVWLRPLPAPTPAPEPATQPARRIAGKPARARPQPAVRAVPEDKADAPASLAIVPPTDSSAASVADTPDTGEQSNADPFAAPPPKPAGKFDMDAARKIARKMANERDPAKQGTPLAQFPDKPLASESQLAKSMGSAARRDCKDGLPGGLLAPLFLLLDKKDHGCKW